jgi:D-alanine-D-alanine ligase-like ATP-grasp enzyme
MEAASRRAFAETMAQSYARVDFIVSERDGLPYMLEINAVPGLKPASLFPQAAMLDNIAYDDIIGAIASRVRAS